MEKKKVLNSRCQVMMMKTKQWMMNMAMSSLKMKMQSKIFSLSSLSKRRKEGNKQRLQFMLTMRSSLIYLNRISMMKIKLRNICLANRGTRDLEAVEEIDQASEAARDRGLSDSGVN